MFKYLLIIFSFLFSSLGFSQIATDSISDYLINKIHPFPNKFNISIALIKDDTVNFIGFSKENDATFIEENKDSLFEIGSLTKVFTSTLLANMVISDEIILTENINPNFPFTFNSDIQLNYISLSNHTSGLYRLPSNFFLFVKNQKNPYKEYTLEHFNDYLENELKLDSKNKSNYSYSNLGAALLAHSLSLNKKKSFEKMLTQRIFSKFDMKSTSFSLPPSCKGVYQNGKFAENWKFNILKGAGGLVSSVKDLSKFILAQFNPENTELQLTRTLTHSISNNMSIGLGWHIIYPNSNNKKYWHNGGTGGFTSSVAFRKSNKTGVIVLSNISSSSTNSKLIDQICFDLLDALK
ncbi:MAG: serine hydrolase domain-containing protein [Vicingaceae bacterium]